MATGIGEALARPDLLRNLVWAELTARYKTTAFGILWSSLIPGDDGNYGDHLRSGRPSHHRKLSRFVLSALLPWTFFQMGVTNAASSLSRASGLVKRVRIPREFVPMSALMASLFHFLISLLCCSD